MNYSKRVDQLFGTLYQHRTLRTIFDTQAAEWDNTPVSKKVEIFEKIIQSEYPLANWIQEYLSYYKSLKKDYVKTTIKGALGILRKNCTDKNAIYQIDQWLNDQINLKNINNVEELSLAEICIKKLDFNKEPGPEFSYSCLPFCAIDSIYSIGVRYEGVQNVIERVSGKFSIPIFRSHAILPNKNDQTTSSQFLTLFGIYSDEELANAVFGNLQRTSSTNGILKATAVRQFLKVLQKFDIEYLQDVSKGAGNLLFEKDIKAIKGQASGISLKYFYMLAGNQDIIKPDRMVKKFIFQQTGLHLNDDDAQVLLLKTAKDISSKLNIAVSALFLDNLIWQYQRAL